MLHPHLSAGDRLQFRLISSLSGCVDFMRSRGWWSEIVVKPTPMGLEVTNPNLDYIVDNYGINPSNDLSHTDRRISAFNFEFGAGRMPLDEKWLDGL